MYKENLRGNMSIQRYLIKHQAILSILVFIVGLILLVIGLLDVVLSNYMPESVTDFTSSFGGWTYWFLLLGAFAVLVFGWYLFDRYRKIKKFNELIESSSKSKFRRNIAEIETLALFLGKEYEEKVIEKEREYNIKR